MDIIIVYFILFIYTLILYTNNNKMPFVQSYNGAMRLLQSIENGTCKGTCKSIWMRHLKYALKTKTNPLGLTKRERKTMQGTIRRLSQRQRGSIQRTQKKYIKRPSPPFPANDFCGKKMKGNDGKMYESRISKAGICSWKPVL